MAKFFVADGAQVYARNLTKKAAYARAQLAAEYNPNRSYYVQRYDRNNTVVAEFWLPAEGHGEQILRCVEY